MKANQESTTGAFKVTRTVDLKIVFGGTLAECDKWVRQHTTTRYSHQKLYTISRKG